MNLDIECIALLSLVLRDSPKNYNLLLCVFARANTPPTPIKFHSNTEYPTFYGYSNEKAPFYLMSKGVIKNVPREGFQKRLISSEHLAYTETVINGATNWDMSKKLEFISKFITLDNHTKYKDAGVYLVIRDKAFNYIVDYVSNNRETVGNWLGDKLTKAFGEVILNIGQNEKPNWPQNPRVEGNKFIFDEKNWIEFKNTGSFRFKIFKILFEKQGTWVTVEKLASDSGVADPKRTIRQIEDQLIKYKSHCDSISIDDRIDENGKAKRRLIYKSP